MPGAPLNVIQFTDTHIYADPGGALGGVNTRDSFRAVHAAAGDGADLVLVTGDLAAEAEPEAYEWLVREFRTIGAPVLCLPGNHDKPAVMSPLVSAAGWQYGGSRQVGGWHLVLLDSAVPDEEYGELGSAEIAALADELERHASLPTLVVLHHHPVPMDSGWMDTMTLRDAAAFWRVIERHDQVRAVLWGHVHQNFDAYRDCVRLLATPSTCVQFAPRSQSFALDRHAPGYRRLRLYADGRLDTDVVRVP